MRSVVSHVVVFGLMIYSLLCPIVPANAQTFSDDEIIDITGLNYGRLQVILESASTNDGNAPLNTKIIELVRKNLLWSGYFDISQEMLNWDIKIIISITDNGRIGANILSAEGITLFTQTEKIQDQQDIERAVLDLVATIVHQLTGEKSIFKSAIVYVRKNGRGAYQLVITDAFGKQSTTIFEDGNINILPRWNPDATTVLFTSLGRKGSRIRQINLETGKVETLFEDIGKISGGTWGPDGKELVVTLSKKGNSDLFRIDLSGKILERLSHRSSSESNPRWSPDGERLLFVSNRSGGVQIYQRDFKHEDTFRMTFEGSYNVEPCWSNDSNSIVYAGIEDGRYYLFIMDREGIYSRKLTKSDRSAEQPIWAPNGRQILYVSKIGNDQKLYLIRSDGTYKRRLTKSQKGISEFNPSWTGIYKWKL